MARAAMMPRGVDTDLSPLNLPGGNVIGLTPFKVFSLYFPYAFSCREEQ